VWRQIPLGYLSKPLVTMAASGFTLAVITGAGLLATKATEYVGNPFLYIKFPAIALGLVNVLLIHRSAPWESPPDARAVVARAIAIGAHGRNVARLLADGDQRRPHDRLLVIVTPARL
jgi:hypothetical protein